MTTDNVTVPRDKPMRLEIALNFADYPRPYHSLACPADMNGELYEALRVLAEAYRAAIDAAPTSAEAVQGDAGDANVAAICERLQARSAVGIAKYGVTTERSDLNRGDWLRHLQEELLDAAVYVEAALGESKA